MTTKYYESPKFTKLRDSWYARLRRSGFRDIEHRNGKYAGLDSPMMGGAVSGMIPEESWENSTYEYYRACDHWYTNWMSACRADVREIWRRHADGQSVAKISREAGIGHNKVQRVIAQQRTEMVSLLQRIGSL